MRGGDCAATGVRGGTPEARGVSSSALAADAAAVAVAMVGDGVGVAGMADRATGVVDVFGGAFEVPVLGAAVGLMAEGGVALVDVVLGTVGLDAAYCPIPCRPLRWFDGAFAEHAGQVSRWRFDGALDDPFALMVALPGEVIDALLTRGEVGAVFAVPSFGRAFALVDALGGPRPFVGSLIRVVAAFGPLFDFAAGSVDLVSLPWPQLRQLALVSLHLFVGAFCRGEHLITIRLESREGVLLVAGKLTLELIVVLSRGAQFVFDPIEVRDLAIEYGVWRLHCDVARHIFTVGNARRLRA